MPDSPSKSAPTRRRGLLVAGAGLLAFLVGVIAQQYLFGLLGLLGLLGGAAMFVASFGKQRRRETAEPPVAESPPVPREAHLASGSAESASPPLVSPDQGVRPSGRRLQLEELTTPDRVVGAAMLAVAVAAFLPWVSLFGFGRLGIEGDGQITLACAVIGLLALIVGSDAWGGARFKRGARVLAWAAGGVVVLIGVVDMNGAAAIGLYLTLFGGVVWVAGLAVGGGGRRTADSR